MSDYKFPEGFLWGAATSSHQIEGNNYNDWSEWEQSVGRVGELKERGLDPRDFVSGRACDSYNRYEEDLDIAKSLNHNVHRFSIEWSRIEPEKGKFNDEEMLHYKTLIGAIRSRGMEPMVTLWHFTNPLWFSQEGGFSNKQSSLFFTRYVKYVVDNLKDDVHLWITFNEPINVYDQLTYLKGVWLAKERGIWKWHIVRRNIIKSHIEAYKTIHSLYSLSPAGEQLRVNTSGQARSSAEQENGVMSHNVWQGNNVFVGSSEFNFYFVGGRLMKLFGFEWVMNRFRKFFWSKALPYHDFLGLNYYTVYRLPGSFRCLKQQDTMKEMLNWEIYPKGIYHHLKDLQNYNKPIYITENGIADRTDQKREKFIKDHLFWVHKAISEGVDVRGYMYWSLLDNFEWAEGFTPCFGLVEVNYDTMERKIRPSAFKYAEICKSNKLLT